MDDSTPVGRLKFYSVLVWLGRLNRMHDRSAAIARHAFLDPAVQVAAAALLLQERVENSQQVLHPTRRIAERRG